MVCNIKAFYIDHMLHLITFCYFVFTYILYINIVGLREWKWKYLYIIYSIGSAILYRRQKHGKIFISKVFSTWKFI